MGQNWSKFWFSVILVQKCVNILVFDVKICKKKLVIRSKIAKILVYEGQESSKMTKGQNWSKFRIFRQNLSNICGFFQGKNEAITVIY